MKIIMTKITPEQTQILIDLVKKIAPRYAFGIYGVEEIKQEAMIYGIQGIVDYDGNRPLENFLYSHIKNRLLNLKRDKFKRVETPCTLCNAKFKQGDSSGGHDGKYCKKFQNWIKRNISKQSLAAPINQVVEFSYECNIDDEIDRKDLFRLIDFNIPLNLREPYLKMRVGDKVTPTQRKLVLIFIEKIRGKNA